MTKKTEHNEPIRPDAATEEHNTAASSADETTVETVIADAAKNTDEESYTLTAEEFAAAKAHIEAITKEKDETVNLLQRIQADFDNFRRRNAGVRLESYEEGKRDAVKEILPSLDSLERALESIPEKDAVWREGIVLVQRQLMDGLKRLGLEEVETDCKFDPVKHEAVMREKAGRQGQRRNRRRSAKRLPHRR